MFLRRLLRVVESFEGRPGRASAWTESNVVFAAACLVRTFGAMRAEGEVSRLWVGWALGWCCLVGAVAAARMAEGAGVGPLLRLASAFDTARAHDTKAEAESSARYLTAWLAGEAYALPPAARSAALRVVAAFDDLVLGGVEAAPCGWCGGPRSSGPAGGVEAAPPGRASQVGASGPAGDPWFRYAPATAGGCCGTCGPECPAKSPGAGVEVWGLRYEQKGSALPSALVLYAVVPAGGGWALLEGEALGLPQPMETPADLLHAVCERNGWRCLGILAPAQVRAAESEAPKG